MLSTFTIIVPHMLVAIGDSPMLLSMTDAARRRRCNLRHLGLFALKWMQLEKILF